MTYNYLKGARFSTPLSDTEDTNAMGRGMIPLIMSVYYTDGPHQYPEWIYACGKAGDLTSLLWRSIRMGQHLEGGIAVQ